MLLSHSIDFDRNVLDFIFSFRILEQLFAGVIHSQSLYHYRFT